MNLILVPMDRYWFLILTIDTSISKSVKRLRNFVMCEAENQSLAVVRLENITKDKNEIMQNYLYWSQKKENAYFLFASFE